MTSQVVGCCQAAAFVDCSLDLGGTQKVCCLCVLTPVPSQQSPYYHPVLLLPMLLPSPGAIMAVEQAARDFSLVVLTSDHDASKGGNAVLDAAAATSVDEGFELAATDNPASTLLQVSVRGCVVRGSQTGAARWLQACPG